MNWMALLPAIPEQHILIRVTFLLQNYKLANVILVLKFWLHNLIRILKKGNFSVWNIEMKGITRCKLTIIYKNIWKIWNM